jgi:acetyl-CoA carboxylase biotin carboxyl carrier protein
MNADEIKQILDLVREHDLAEFELERDGVKIRIRTHGGVQVVAAPPVASSQPTGHRAGMAAPAAGPRGPHPPSAAAEVGDDADTMELAVVTSPMVGTFYRAPEPGAAPFVDVGTAVRRGQVLCIIEAMKLMNELESEYEGEIVKVYVENGQPVQYGERLFAIRVA